jgi:hypothetical protein
VYRLSSQSAALATKVPSLDAGSTFLLAGGAFLLIVFAFLLWRRAERRHIFWRDDGYGVYADAKLMVMMQVVDNSSHTTNLIAYTTK